MALVGIIANPASGKDIRRLVAHGSVFDNQEKVRIVRRILLGLSEMGVDRICFMPDYYGIVGRASGEIEIDAHVKPILAPGSVSTPCRSSQAESGASVGPSVRAVSIRAFIVNPKSPKVS